MLEGRTIADGADYRKLRQIEATYGKITHLVSSIKFHQNWAGHIVSDIRGEGLCLRSIQKLQVSKSRGI